jgi:lysophospholipase L1-like esterase
MKISHLLLGTFLAVTASVQIAHAQAPTDAEREQAAIQIRKYYLFRTAIFDADKSKYDIVMLGDSLTEGANWNALFPGQSIANRGIGGDTTEGMLNRMNTVLGVAPHKVFIMAGINDIAVSNWPVPEVFERYRRMVDMLRAAKVQVVVQSTLFTGPAFPPAVNVAVADLDNRLQSYCATGACRYVNINPLVAPTGTLDLRYTTDHLHVNALGYQAWVTQISPLISR